MAERSLETRFWSKVSTGEGCWEWQGWRSAIGYGLMRVSPQRTKARAHRVSWELAHGEIPGGLNVLHRCDNRRCVRPDHLFLGTQQDNIADMDAKKRRGELVGAAGERHGMAKLTDSDVAELVALRAQGWLHRELAERYGVDGSCVSRILAGRRRTVPTRGSG